MLVLIYLFYKSIGIVLYHILYILSKRYTLIFKIQHKNLDARCSYIDGLTCSKHARMSLYTASSSLLELNSLVKPRWRYNSIIGIVTCAYVCSLFRIDSMLSSLLPLVTPRFSSLVTISSSGQSKKSKNCTSQSLAISDSNNAWLPISRGKPSIRNLFD